MPQDPTLRRYLDSRPSDEEAARARVAAYRGLDVAARLEALTALLWDMDVLLRGRRPLRAPDDTAFWKHWKDPSVGRPR